MSKHPMQRIEFDERGVIRFRANKIIKDLLDSGAICRVMLASLRVAQS